MLAEKFIDLPQKSCFDTTLTTTPKTMQFKPMSKLLFDTILKSFNPLVASSNLARPTSIKKPSLAIVGVLSLWGSKYVVSVGDNVNLVGPKGCGWSALANRSDYKRPFKGRLG